MVVQYLEMRHIFFRVMSFSYLLLLTKLSLFFYVHWKYTHRGNDRLYCGKSRKCRQGRFRLKAHALSVTLPGLNFFRSKFDSGHRQLAPQMKLLKLSFLCNPVRLREIEPSPEQWINMPNLSWSAVKSLQFCCSSWRMNCQCSGHLQMTSMPTYLIWSQFFLFF